MELTGKQPRFTSLFANDVLSRVERLRINSDHRFTNRSRGEHHSGKGGSSTEFADYRDYVEGDDVRFIDWNIFSRLRRPYLKLYHQEEEMHVVIVVDASASMAFEEKLERAKQLAGVFGVMGLMNAEKVSVWSLGGDSPRVPNMPPITGRVGMRRLFQFVEAIEAGGTQSIDAGIDAILKHHRGRGVMILLSDFLTFGNVKRSFNRLFSTGLEPFAIQILGPAERDPELSGDLRLFDSETGERLDISSAGQLLHIYHDHRLALEQELDSLCRQRGGKFLDANSGDALETFLFDTLRRKGWIR